MRRMTLLLGCGKSTVQRKIAYLASEAKKHHQVFLKQLAEDGGTAYVMFDELETFIHARYKQVSVPVAIRVKTGQVLAFGVARMPSTMKLGGPALVPSRRVAATGFTTIAPRSCQMCLHSWHLC